MVVGIMILGIGEFVGLIRDTAYFKNSYLFFILFAVMFEMSNGAGLRRHTSAYCVSIATTDATLATAATRNSVYQPGLFSTDDN